MPSLDEIRASARSYARQSGIHLPDRDYSKVVAHPSVTQQVGQAYGRMASFNEAALPAYHAMREETLRQFDHMTSPRSRGGLGLNVEVSKEDPYGSGGLNTIYREFRDDVVHNNRMKVYSTASSGGHPIFDNDTNDAFRAVHDVYGHLGSGRGIDRHGEEAAFQKHSRMFSPLARQAMTSETRGQNSAYMVEGGFPEQKVNVLPSHMQSLQFQVSPEEHSAALKDAAGRSRAQGI